MMKLVVVLIVALATVAAATNIDVKVDSALGKYLLSNARKLEQNNNNNNNNNQDFQYAWVGDYSIKFQGCHHVQQWNDNANDNQDVRISTTRLVRFRLCPTQSCSAKNAGGCSSGYGDYVIDLPTFMEAYFEAKKKQMEADCQNYLYYNCDCNEDNQGDDFNKDYCEYNCFVDAGMEECIENNPYDENGNQGQQFDLQDYMQCAAIQMNNNNNNNNNNNGGRRKLDQNNGNGYQYYVGPFCAQQGGEVNLGLFSDDTCTQFADVDTFEALYGMELPYKDKSLVDANCLECIEPQNGDNQNDQADGDQVAEVCEQLYMGSGKCEAGLADNTVYERNNNACNYMQGIRIVRSDGLIMLISSRPSAVATAFIVIFAMAFAAMAFYVWYLRTRLGIKKNALL